MGKAAASEPSMDEILSSIRQIISEDDVENVKDETVVEEVETLDVMAQLDDGQVPETNEIVESEMQKENKQDDLPTDEALELSAEQIIDEGNDVSPDLSDLESNLDTLGQEDIPIVVTDDIEFDGEIENEMIEIDEPAMGIKSLPDPDLSGNIADKLLEPATDAAVASAFAQLGSLGISDKDLTVESMIREMLRPMLKGWLDENLPTVVENMVRKEIERLSRGS